MPQNGHLHRHGQTAMGACASLYSERDVREFAFDLEPRHQSSYQKNVLVPRFFRTFSFFEASE